MYRGGSDERDGSGEGPPRAPRALRSVAQVSVDFEEFYRQQYVTFVKLVGLITGSQSDAEDTVQEGFALIAGRFGDLDNPVAYLRTTVVNMVKTRYRDQQRHRDRLAMLRPEGGRSDNHETVELAEIIATLPLRQRVVIVGRYWAGWSEQEIARVLGCRPGTVKSLGSRAMETLRHQIEEGGR